MNLPNDSTMFTSETRMGNESGQSSSRTATMLNRHVFLLVQFFSILIRQLSASYIHPLDAGREMLQNSNEPGGPETCNASDFQTPAHEAIDSCHAALHVMSCGPGYIYPVLTEWSFSGRRGSRTASMLNRHAFLLVPVSYFANVKCFRSNDVCLLLLFCPNSTESVFMNYLSFFVNLLILCGDVEQNPGPNHSLNTNAGSGTNHELLLSILEGQKEMIHRMDEFSATQASLTAMLDQCKTA